MAAADLLGEGDVELTLQLPDVGGSPISCPPHDEPPAKALGGAHAPPSAERHLSLWTAPGFALDPSPAAKLLWTLTSTPDGDQPFTDARPSCVALGSDIRFASHAVAMVMELLTRGRVLPDLEFVAERWRACWRPIIDGRDRNRIEALVWALPASFVAVRVAQSNTANWHHEQESETSDEVLRSLMWAATDTLARDLATPTISKAPATPTTPTARRRGAKANVVDAWFAALASPEGDPGECDEDEFPQLGRRLAGWHATMSADVEAVRTCFRIVPPPDDGEEQPRDTGRATSTRKTEEGRLE